MKITIHTNPMGKPRMTQRDRWLKRPVTQRYWDYKAEVKIATESVPYIESMDTLNAIFVMQMPKSWSKKKKLNMVGTHHQQKPDIDNLVKGLLDAMLEEDKAVHTVYATKLWGDIGEVTITI